MPAERRFCRFRANPTSSGGYEPLPTDGMCLSTFLLLSAPGHPREVLVGRVAPSPKWRRIGALGIDRIKRFQDGWMLPSSHLMLFESPSDAARRIAEEQLGVKELELSGPLVVSDPYARDQAAGADPHWDLHFIFRAALRGGIPAPRDLWTELRFVDARVAPAEGFVRAHGDIIRMGDALSPVPANKAS